jgi:Protein of unknown function DUF262/HNH endonuclease
MRFFYGIQKAVRMRPLVLRLALLHGLGRDLILIHVDPSTSDRLGRFRTDGGRREWKVMRYEVPPGGIPPADYQYFVDQFVESFENTTGRRAQLHPDNPLLASTRSQSVVSADAASQSTEPCSPPSPVAPPWSPPVSDQPESAADPDQEDESGNSAEPIREDRDTIRWQQSDLSIYEICRRYKQGRIELQPEFQRDYVWKPLIARRFIESILLRLPLPTVYLAETDDGRYLVIDGQQRLTTILEFYDSKLALSQLRVLSDLNGLRFKDLDRAWQARFEDHHIITTVLDRSCSPDLKFDMFERLNSGSVRLNKQELRNCIYRGDFNRLLTDLARSREFVTAVGWKEPDRRMKGQELVLRFFTFLYHNVEGIRDYEGALSSEMREHAHLSPDALARRRNDFREALGMCISVFGALPFRSWARARGDAEPNGHWESRFSGTVLEVLMTGFASYPKPVVIRNADAIREEFIHLLTTDQFFFDSMTFGTNAHAKLSYRNLTWRATLRQVLDSAASEPRCFQLSFKEQLWRTDPTCALCGQRIHTVDDAAVDHIVHYWRGGKTIPSNARLAHRYCNVRRGGGDGPHDHLPALGRFDRVRGDSG